MNLKEAKQILQNAKGDINSVVTAVMESRTFSYETFGKEIEPFVLDSLIEVFNKSGQKKLRKAKNKNEFPDLTVTLSDGLLAADIKTGNHFKKSNGRWVSCNNSNNDLGTIRSWPDKLQKFGGDNIFFIFVEYSITDTLHQVEEIRIAPFYKFLDISSHGLLKYRKKDGNLRPKDFDAPSPIDSVEKFTVLLKATEIERAKSIIEEHIKTIPKEERNVFLDQLKVD